MEFHVRVAEAAQLPSMDVIGKSDPYCTVRYSTFPKDVKTKTIPNNNDPIWNAEFSFPVSALNRDTVSFSVFDKDLISKDDLIGSLILKVSDFPEGVVVEKWFPLSPAKGIKNAGKIHLYLHLARLGQPRFVPSK